VTISAILSKVSHAVKKWYRYITLWNPENSQSYGKSPLPHLHQTISCQAL